MRSLSVLKRDFDPMTTHPLDIATKLTPAGDGRWKGHTSPAYWNMMGPFGGVTAAVMLQAALNAPQRIGDPVALTVNFCAPIAEGEFTIALKEVRTNRSTQHWSMELSQEGGGIAASASAVFALRRETWDHQPVTPPAIAPFDTLRRFDTAGRIAWASNYDMRFGEGELVYEPRPDEEPGPARSVLWMADHPARPLDFTALSAIADAFIVRIFHVRGRPVPAGTVSITTYFHTDEAGLAANGAAPLIGMADSKVFRKGYFDQSAELWSADGRLLASSVQTVYYKE